MQILDIVPKAVNLNNYAGRSASESDAATFINYDCLIKVNGESKILYMTMPEEITWPIEQAVRSIKYATNKRTGGLKTTSMVFGYKARKTLIQDFCSNSKMAVEYPAQHAALCDFATYTAKVYKQYFPAIYEKHVALVKHNILTDWVIGKSPFTSGIVNKNSQLKYHFDRGNYEGVMSNMLAFKNNTNGGYLVLPEYDLKLEIASNTLLIFDGQSILHGVSEIKPFATNYYRYTIVYYTLKQMWKCETVGGELERIRKVKKGREFKRIKKN